VVRADGKSATDSAKAISSSPTKRGATSKVSAPLEKMDSACPAKSLGPPESAARVATSDHAPDPSATSATKTRATKGQCAPKERKKRASKRFIWERAGKFCESVS